MRPAKRSFAIRAMHSADRFTQPTVLITQISLRVATRPLGRRYPMNVGASRETASLDTGSYTYDSPGLSAVLRLCECTHAPGSTASLDSPMRCPNLTTASPSPIDRKSVV